MHPLVAAALLGVIVGAIMGAVIALGALAYFMNYGKEE
jgi:hypothetical protein